MKLFEIFKLLAMMLMLTSSHINILVRKGSNKPEYRKTETNYYEEFCKFFNTMPDLTSIESALQAMSPEERSKFRDSFNLNGLHRFVECNGKNRDYILDLPIGQCVRRLGDSDYLALYQHPNHMFLDLKVDDGKVIDTEFGDKKDEEQTKLKGKGMLGKFKAAKKHMAVGLKKVEETANKLLNGESLDIESFNKANLKCSKFITPGEIKFFKGYVKDYPGSYYDSESFVKDNKELVAYINDNELETLAKGNKEFFELEKNDGLNTLLEFLTKLSEKNPSLMKDNPAINYNIISVLLTAQERPLTNAQEVIYKEIKALYKEKFYTQIKSSCIIRDEAQLKEFKNNLIPGISLYETYYNLFEAGEMKDRKEFEKALICVEASLQMSDDVNLYIEKFNIQTTLYRHEDAFETAKIVYKKFHYNVYVKYMKGVALMKVNKLDLALGVLEEIDVSGINNKKLAHEYYNNIIQLNMLLQNKAGALDNLENYLQTFGKEMKYSAIKGDIYKHFGMFRKAMKSYLEQLTDTEDVSMLINLGIVYTRLKQYDDAVNILKKAVKDDPTNLKANYYLGKAIMKQSSITNAQQYFDVVINFNPTEPLSYYYKGLTYVALMNYESAQQMFSNSLELDEYFLEGKLALANVLLKKNDFEEALSIFEYCSVSNSKSLEAIIGLGDAYFGLMNFEVALSWYENAIKINKQFKLFHLKKGKALSELGNYDQAIASFELAIKKDKKYGDAYCYMGKAFQDNRNNKQALIHIKKALQKDIEDVETYNYIMYYFYNTYKFNEVIEAFEKAALLGGASDDILLSFKIKSLIKIHKNWSTEKLNQTLKTYFKPSDNRYKYFEAFYYSERQNFDKSNKLLNEIIKWTEALVLLGENLLEQHSHEKAIQVFTMAKALKNDSYIIKKLGISYYMNGKNELALKEFGEIKSYQDTEFYYFYALALKVGKQPEKEKEMIDLGIITSKLISPKDYYFLAKLYLETKKVENASESLDTAISLNETYYEAFMAKGDIERTRSINPYGKDFYSKAINVRPNSSIAHRYLGDALHKLGQTCATQYIQANSLGEKLLEELKLIADEKYKQNDKESLETALTYYYNYLKVKTTDFANNDKAEIYFRMGVIDFLQKNFDGAEGKFGQASKLSHVIKYYQAKEYIKEIVKRNFSYANIYKSKYAFVGIVELSKKADNADSLLRTFGFIYFSS
jgi:tetratricopeptide (TPR) repeat protein